MGPRLPEMGRRPGNKFMRAALALFAALALAACGAQTPGGDAPRATPASAQAAEPAPPAESAPPPWSTPVEPGLWVRFVVAGPDEGQVWGVCHAPGDNIRLVQDEHNDAGNMTCQPIQRTATADGWTAQQDCTLDEVPVRFHFSAKGDPARSLRLTMTGRDPETREAILPTVEVQIERRGACPEGWTVGEVLKMEMRRPDGRYVVIVPPVVDGRPRSRTIASLPPELTNLRAPPRTSVQEPIAER